MDDQQHQKNLPRSIVQYLKSELEKQYKEQPLGNDFIESIEVAVQCLQSAYRLTDGANTAAAVDEGSPAAATVPSLSAAYAAGCRALASVDRQAAEQLKAEGNHLISENRPLEAIDAYTRAIRLEPHNAVYYCNRAAAYSKLGDHEAAILDCERALREDPGYVKAFGRLGFAHAALGRHGRAAEYYGRALQLDPECASYRQNLATASAALAAADPSSPAGETPGSQQRQQPAGRSRLPPEFEMMMHNPDQLRRATEMAAGMAGRLPPSMNLSLLNSQDLTNIGQEFANFLAANNPDLAESLQSTLSRGRPDTGAEPEDQDSNDRPPDYIS